MIFRRKYRERLPSILNINLSVECTINMIPILLAYRMFLHLLGFALQELEWQEDNTRGHVQPQHVYKSDKKALMLKSILSYNLRRSTRRRGRDLRRNI
jgi:hypothetical protein